MKPQPLTDRQRAALQLSWRIATVTRVPVWGGPHHTRLIEDRMTFTPEQLLEFVAKLDEIAR